MKHLVKLFFVIALFVSVKAQASNLPDFSALAEKHSNAVVSINSTRTIKGGQRPAGPQFQGPGADHFNEMFERFFGPQQQFEVPDYNAQSLGSGFFISTDGYIITNYHVIREADTIIVGMVDGSELEAEIVGVDPTSDLALLKVAASKEYEVLAFGSSDDLKVGEWVLAIGSPFGFDYSVTQGIVSAKGRGLHTDKYVPFIQTDVAINPGSSGGPLMNLEGEVVGVNAQIVSRSGGYLGLSFAIPSMVVKDVVAQLLEDGKVQRGYLGVAFQNVDKDLAASFGLKQPKGALVAEVMEEGPAKDAGFKPGDVIISFDGKAVDSASDLPHLVGFTKPGTKVKVEVMRDGKKKNLNVTVGELDNGEDVVEKAPEEEGESNILGFDVREMTSDESRQFNDKGVIISKVYRDTPAVSSGLRNGDIILSLNHKQIDTLAEFNQVLDKVKAGDTVPVLMQRQNGGQRFIALKIPKD